MKRLPQIALILLCVAATGAAAQVGLPPLPGVPLPPVPLPGVVNDTLRTAQSPLATLRKTRIQDLLRRERDTVEADPDGQPILRHQIGALSPTDAALTKAKAAGFTVLRDEKLGALGLQLVILQAPDGMSTRRALKRMRKLDPDGTYDYHHLYLEGGAASGPAAESPAPQTTSEALPSAGARVGLIDSGIDAAHPALAGTTVHRFGCDGASTPGIHGTAVASLLTGNAPGFHGVLPGAELYAADVFCGHTAGSIALLAIALDWMAGQQVGVVNISLVGAKSVLLTGIVRAMGARGHLLVAAVGNDGPAAPPLFPAAYPEVIGVTGVDPERHVLPEACRGQHVAFAAPGSEMRAAAPGGGWNVVRGTSFASPIVAGLLAQSLPRPDAERARAAITALSAQAVDLGPAGRDTTYGRGLVGFSYRVPAEPAGS